MSSTATSTHEPTAPRRPAHLTLTSPRRGLASDVRREIRVLLRWPQLTLAAAVVALPSAVGLLFVVPGYALIDELDLSSLLVGSAVPMAFPLLAAALAAPSMASELRHHFLASTRTRTPVRRYLLAKVVAGGLLGFVVFALAALVPIVVSFGVVPHMGLVQFHPDTVLLTAEQVVGTRPGRYTFSQVFAAGPSLGPWLYALLHAGWAGLNGALYTVLPMVLLVVLRSPLLALSAPLLGYHLGSFATALAGWDIFGPLTSVFPFTLAQQPMWTVLVPFTVLLTLTAVLLVSVLRSAPHRDVLS
ncbi:hypothetical protein SAMN06264364_10872 [Quadrisphaera granulorum]|uniref:ABC-2 family transporter n=1 Tax=Quadrisphaera granulorum TaxID=317664 RepID=A0A316A8U4_9ACTN|nr:hypothetical protein [Quadrisphaera granulorum]PWJ54165.1 hypothetical protein BXY45_10872 [Quadrisphaera granulorum]SZE96304.1 hypothetical protein SAMN06264364_10872 [Quadrisphaera granulorum]